MVFRKIKKFSYTQPLLARSFILVLYKLLLDIMYLIAIHPVYEYAGMSLSFSWYKYILSTALFIVLLKPIIRLYDEQTTSSLIILLFNLLYFIPGCTMYSLYGMSDLYFAFFALYWGIIMALQKVVFIRKLSHFNQKSRKIIFTASLALIIVGILLITGRYNGFKLHFSLSDVYQLRFAQRGMALPVWVNYYQPIAATIAPIAIVYCLVNRKYLWVMALLFIQLLSFAFGGMRMTLFFLFVAFLSYYFYDNRRSPWIVGGLMIICLLSVIEIVLRNSSYLNSIVYRVLFIPNLLSYQYFDFFRDHELLLWRDSILHRLGFASPYTLPVTNLISEVYYADPSGVANNGLCGDAFSNFGWVSLIFFPFLILVYTKLIDACSPEIDHKIKLITAVILAIGFTNSSFFILMLSNGFIFACIFLYALPVRKLIMQKNYHE